MGAVKLVLHEMAAFHATGYHFIPAYPGGREVLAAEHPSIFAMDMLEFFKGKGGADDLLDKFLNMTVQMYSSCVVVLQGPIL